MQKLTKEVIEANRSVLQLNVRVFRVTKGWTQKELATRGQVGLVTVTSLETGRLLPTVKTVKKLAKAFNLSPEEMLKKQEGFTYSNESKKSASKNASEQASKSETPLKKDERKKKKKSEKRKRVELVVAVVMALVVGVAIGTYIGAEITTNNGTGLGIWGRGGGGQDEESFQVKELLLSKEYQFVPEEVAWSSPAKYTLIDTEKEREVVKKGVTDGFVFNPFNLNVEIDSDFVLSQSAEGFTLFPLSVVKVLAQSRISPTQNEKQLLPVDFLIVPDSYLLDPIETEEEIQQILESKMNISNPNVLAVGASLAKAGENQYFVFSEGDREALFFQIDPISEAIQYLVSGRLPPELEAEFTAEGGDLESAFSQKE